MDWVIMMAVYGITLGMLVVAALLLSVLAMTRTGPPKQMDAARHVHLGDDSSMGLVDAMSQPLWEDIVKSQRVCALLTSFVPVFLLVHVSCDAHAALANPLACVCAWVRA